MEYSIFKERSEIGKVSSNHNISVCDCVFRFRSPAEKLEENYDIIPEDSLWTAPREMSKTQLLLKDPIFIQKSVGWYDKISSGKTTPCRHLCLGKPHLTWRTKFQLISLANWSCHFCIFFFNSRVFQVIMNYLKIKKILRQISPTILYLHISLDYYK